MASGDWEVGATDLPSPKKRSEGTFAAVSALVRQFGAVGLEASAADMLQRLRGIGVVLVSAGFLASVPDAVELHADLIGLHEGPRDTVDVGRGSLWRVLGVAPLAGTTTTGAGIPVEAREGDTLLRSVLLSDLLISRPNAFEAFLDGSPIISPFELPHLPGVVDLLVRFEDDLMVMSERHIREELEK